MMTNKLVVILSICLLINGFNFLVFDVNIIRNEFFTSNLVYLISSCLLLRQFDVLPEYLWNNYPKFCTVLELPLSILLLELFLYAWLRLQEFIILNSDFLLVWLSDKSGFNWFFCHFCCDCVRRCPDVFANLVMQATSFAFLFSVCSFLRLSLFRSPTIDVVYNRRQCASRRGPDNTREPAPWDLRTRTELDSEPCDL